MLLQNHFLLDLWYDLANVKSPFDVPEISLNEHDNLYVTEKSDEFNHLRYNRLVMGAYRYGRIGDKDTKLDWINAIIIRVSLYKETNNLEYLLDIANCAEMEWMFSRKSKHFTGEDHGRCTIQ